MKLWVDDIRPAPDGWVWVKTSFDAINVICDERVAQRTITHLSLDHDLGGDDTTRPIIMWMWENDIWPDNITVHSSNPVGKIWLEGMIERYKT